VVQDCVEERQMGRELLVELFEEADHFDVLVGEGLELDHDLGLGLEKEEDVEVIEQLEEEDVEGFHFGVLAGLVVVGAVVVGVVAVDLVR
jgi:hypothetical protein